MALHGRIHSAMFPPKAASLRIGVVFGGAIAAACLTLVVTPLMAAEDVRVERKPPRPDRTAGERDAEARRLREIYRGDRNHWPPPTVDPGIEWHELGLLPDVVHPESNPLNPAKVMLGRTLFFDPRLSASGKLACASCHEPNLGWADGRALSQPLRPAPARNTPTIRNAAFHGSLFWDGRASSLEDQAEQALTNPMEMGAVREHVVGTVAGIPWYRGRYAEAFPDEPVTLTGVIKAVACFERTIVSGRSRFDDFMAGDAAALSDAELIGLDLFRRDARCMNCHYGPMFSDGRFHDLGLSFYGRSREDRGRHAVTGKPEDVGRFRTPSLRDVTRTMPLMHTGMFQLKGVLTMYNAGMVTLKRQDFQRDDPLFPVKSPHLEPLGLNQQDLADLAAFLGSLEEPRHRVMPPQLPEPDEPAPAAGR
jgi:cytochrome c peroxidase